MHKPGLVVLLASRARRLFCGGGGTLSEPARRLLAWACLDHRRGVRTLPEHGAEIIVGGEELAAQLRFANTLFCRVSGDAFLWRTPRRADGGFGVVSLLLRAGRGADAGHSAPGGELDRQLLFDSGRRYALYDWSRRWCARSGAAAQDKMTTGVAVSPAMNHGGPYPATGHPGFTQWGFPARCCAWRVALYDNVRHAPAPELRDQNQRGGVALH